MLNIHYFQHVPFEGLGIIEGWIKEKGHTVTSTQFYENAKLPDLNAIDWLIVMGGPMGVYDEDKYPYLKLEKQFIKGAIDKQKTVLGICLGAQLIAEVLGSKVYPNTQKEIGWFPIQKTKVAKEDSLFDFIPDSFNVFHWHGDTFNLPDGAMHIAESDLTLNQAFRYNENVVGLQFHFEVGEKDILGMVDGADNELIKDAYVQTADEILSKLEYTPKNNQIMREILDRLSVGMGRVRSKG